MITRLWNLRYLRVAGLAAGAVAVAGAAVVVTASAAGMSFGFRPAGQLQSNGASLTAVDANAPSSVCGSFMKHFAVRIGKSQADINAAFQKAIADTLADEVKSGQITQAQADTIKQKLSNQTPCALPSAIGRPGGKDKGEIGAYLQQYMSAAASALGITPAQLKTDLAKGQSLSQVAAAQKVSEADFRTKLVANLKPVLDKAVADKKLTSPQEQMLISRLQTGQLPLWNTPIKRRPAPTTTPSPTTT
ncbi:MAG: hypothetical protein E6I96_14980 [Chloroflexi bacterium]|nr:MAG: hypothetical protein E6I96_14980 [Chloroflexota bacterium]